MNEEICGYIDNKPIYRFVFEPIRSNMYIVICDNAALIVDPFINDSVKKFLLDKNVTDATIILTHEHYDHVSGVNAVRELCKCTVISNIHTKHVVEAEDNNLAKYYLALFVYRPEDEKLARELLINNYTCMVDISFENCYEMDWHSIHFEMRNTPGHSDGSICIVMSNNYIFTGDTLVGGAQIITRLPGGSRQKYFEVTQKYLQSLDDNMYVFPGHGEPGEVSTFDIK